MSRNFKYNSLEDIPEQFLRNLNKSSCENKVKDYSTKEIYTNKLNNSFDNIWILLIILVILDII